MGYEEQNCKMHLPAVQHKYIVADGNGEESRVIRSMLKKINKEQSRIEECNNLESLKNILDNDNFEALIVADNVKNLINNSISETIAYLEATYPNLPMIIIADVYDSQLAITSIGAGAQEYILKRDLSTDLLSRSLHYSIERKLSQLKLKQTLEKVSKKNLQLEKLTRYDYLTGLPNRAHFEATTMKLLLRAARQKKNLALILLNIDEFKKINETYGRGGGDELIRQITYRVNQSLRKTEFFSRIAGDEFAIITDVINDTNEVYPLANRILNCFLENIKIAKSEVKVDVSLGVSFYPNALTLESLHKHADIAMHKAKNDCTKAACFFSIDMETEHYRAMQVEAQIQNGINQREFFAKYQMVYTKNKKLSRHVELLAYWHSKVIGEVTPTEFLPLVKNSPAINNITFAVVNDSKKLGEIQSDISIHLNIFTRQLNESEFISNFTAALKHAGLDPSNICLEINESDIVSSLESSWHNINYLKEQGFTFALDNFGQNLSSAQLLISLPIDIIKLDRSIIGNLHNNQRATSFCESIIDFCHKNKIQVIAQGIESKQEFDVLKALNVDFFQGFYLSNVEPLENLDSERLNTG